MTQRRLAPHAAALMESMRGVGYDAKSALADLIDNSISAGAASLWIRFEWTEGDPTVFLLDDGHGMLPDELDRAMTLGSQNPAEPRSATDLGRFGLGLKTASLSQCSRLVVASRRLHQPVSVRVWDLTTIKNTDDWIIDDELTVDEEIFVRELEKIPAGTLILWRKLDRLVGASGQDTASDRLDFQRTARDAEAHLGMIFHRYLEGSRPRLRIYMNGSTDEFRVKPWDPFCIGHPATQHLPEVRRGGNVQSVRLQGYVLPHKDRFDAADYDLAGGPAGWVGQQGFYVYRHERLLLPGSWLGLGQPRKWNREEQYKLARIRLDLPNSLDSSWSIDIKKSTAHPPLHIRSWLTRNAEGVRQEAREVFVHRGNRAAPAAQNEFSPAWFAEGGPSPSYRINRKHPAITAALEAVGRQAPFVERALKVLETTVPLHRIWLDMAEKPESPVPTRQMLPSAEIGKLAEDLLNRMMTGQNLSRAAAVQRLRLIEPFEQYPEVLAALDT